MECTTPDDPILQELNSKRKNTRMLVLIYGLLFHKTWVLILCAERQWSLFSKPSSGEVSNRTQRGGRNFEALWGGERKYPAWPFWSPFGEDETSPLWLEVVELICSAWAWGGNWQAPAAAFPFCLTLDPALWGQSPRGKDGCGEEEECEDVHLRLSAHHSDVISAELHTPGDHDHLGPQTPRCAVFRACPETLQVPQETLQLPHVHFGAGTFPLVRPEI